MVFSCNMWSWKRGGYWYLKGKWAHFFACITLWDDIVTASETECNRPVVSVKSDLARLQLHFTQRRRTLPDPSKLPGQESWKGFSDSKISIWLLVIWCFAFRKFVCFCPGLCVAASPLNSISTRSGIAWALPRNSRSRDQHCDSSVLWGFWCLLK